MSAAERRNVVVEFADRPAPGPLKNIVDTLRAVLGKMVSLVDVCLLAEATPYVVTNAAVAPGTALGFTRCLVDFSDAGGDQVRVVARGANSVAGTIQVVVFDVTNSVELARVAIVGATAQTVAGPWTTIKPSGIDHELEVQVIGNGVDDPELMRVSLQVRTLKAP